MSGKKERVLTFKYAFECKDEMRKLKSVLAENHIEFICYESNGYYPHEFVVRKSGKKWNDIMHIINSIHAVPYKYTHKEFLYIDGKLSAYA